MDMLAPNFDSQNGSSQDSSSVDRESSTSTNRPGTLAYLNVSDLQVDESYQRICNEAHANRIANNWDWRKVKCLNVAVRVQSNKPSFFVYDGQHTVIAAKKLGIEQLPCYIIGVDSVKDEAVGFVGINRDRRVVTSAGQMKAMVKAEDERAIRLKSILNRHGIRLSEGKTTDDKATQAIGALLKIMEYGGKDNNLDSVLDFIMKTWNGKSPSLSGSFLNGVWSFLSRVRESVGLMELSHALKRHSAADLFVRVKVVARARSHSTSSVTDIWREVLLEAYNHNRRKSNRLSLD